LYALSETSKESCRYFIAKDSAIISVNINNDFSEYFMGASKEEWEKNRRARGYGTGNKPHPAQPKQRPPIPEDLPEEIKQWLAPEQKLNESLNHLE